MQPKLMCDNRAIQRTKVHQTTNFITTKTSANYMQCKMEKAKPGQQKEDVGAGRCSEREAQAVCFDGSTEEVGPEGDVYWFIGGS